MARILIIRKHKTNNMKRYYILAFYILFIAGTATAQEETISLTLQQAIEIAQEHSPQAQAARHTYRAAYWNYRFFRANYLPSVTLSSSPNLNREINKITQPDGTNQFVKQNQLSTDLSLKINQNVWFTGGSFFIKTTTQRIDEFEMTSRLTIPNQSLSVMSSPFSVIIP